jgi:hypothetical protein
MVAAMISAGVLLAFAHAVTALSLQSTQTLNKRILENSGRRDLRIQSDQSGDLWPALDIATFPAHKFTQRLDHFDKSVNRTFGQRYWISTRHYKPGGPVIVVDGGETSGEDRLAFMDTGIIDILANATNGLGGLPSLIHVNSGEY